MCVIIYGGTIKNVLSSIFASRIIVSYALGGVVHMVVNGTLASVS